MAGATMDSLDVDDLRVRDDGRPRWHDRLVHEKGPRGAKNVIRFSTPAMATAEVV